MMRARRLLGAVVAQGEEAGGIERIVEEEATAAVVLGFWATGTPAAGLRPRPARGKRFLSNLLLY